MTTSLLPLAFGELVPGAPLPPGPRANDWTRCGAEPVDLPTLEARLLDDLWGARGHHRHVDGTPSSVPCRLVPSAGAAYPVQWHVVVPEGAPSLLGPGRYAYDPSAARLVRRSGTTPPGDRVTLVVTVQPGRTFGRYRHRAWPLWVADAAYAVEAVRALVADAELPSDWADLAAARRLLDVPPGGRDGWWAARGLAPEICLARIELPTGWSVDPHRRDLLARRRSPRVTAFEAARGGSASTTAQEAARQSEQGWLLGADRVLAWPRPSSPAEPAGYPGLWRAHRRAARLCYRLAARGVGVRPVSGFVRPPGPGRPPLLHALAVLREAGEPR